MAKVTLTSKFSAMKSALPVLASVLVFASCTTAYKSGQTPDDVYYSPERPKEYVRTEKKDNRRVDDGEYRDDRYIRMKIRDRRYVGLHDDYYSYNPYYYHYYNSSLYYNSPWNNHTYWNYYYNPCGFCSACGTYPSKTVTRTPRAFDLSVYNSPNTKNVKGVSFKGGQVSYGNNTPGNTIRNYGSGKSNTGNYNNSGRNAGDFVRDAFGGSNNSSGVKGSSSSSPSRSSSGSSGGGSSNAGARKF